MFVTKILKSAQKMPLPEQCPPLLGRIRRLKPIDREGSEAIELIPGRSSGPGKGIKKADDSMVLCNPCAVIGPNRRQPSDFTDYSR
jgi:hypothetical protein